MRAVCPSCEAVYEIPDRLIGAGRRLRCANCGNQWTVLPPGAPTGPAAPPSTPPEAPGPPPPKPAAAAPAPAPAPRTEPPPAAPAAAGLPPVGPMLRRAPQVIDPPLPPVDDTTGRRVRRGGDLALRAAWVASVLAVLLALAALWALRHEIADAWPPAARLVGTPTDGG